MNATVIVVGPQGCGKTLQAQQLRRHFGCSGLVEEWVPGDPLQPGALHLAAFEEYGAVRGARVVPWASLVAQGVVRDMRGPLPLRLR